MRLKQRINAWLARISYMWYMHKATLRHLRGNAQSFVDAPDWVVNKLSNEVQVIDAAGLFVEPRYSAGFIALCREAQNEKLLRELRKANHANP